MRRAWACTTPAISQKILRPRHFRLSRTAAPHHYFTEVQNLDRNPRRIAMGSPARSNKAALIGAVFIAAVVVWGILNVNFSREKAIDAGDIDVVIGGLGSHGQPVPNFIRGSFMVSTPMIKRRTIKSQGTGGACLVANLNILNPGQPGMSTPGKIENPDTGTPKRPCLKNSDCQRFLNP